MTDNVMNDMPNKKYDYWLIVWSGKDSPEVHEPIAFQVGVHPKEWCDAILDRSNNTRETRSPRWTSYKMFKLELSSEYTGDKHE